MASFTNIFRKPVGWRQPASLYAPLGWFAALLWPGVVGTLFMFAPTEDAGGLLNDWRLKALVAAGVAIAAILWIVRRERKRDGGPSTRLGVMSRFILFGFIFSLAALILMVLGFSVFSAFGNESFLAALGGIESTLFLFGVAGLPFALMVGISYALWAGLMVSLITFSTRAPNTRRKSAPLDMGAPPADPDAEPEVGFDARPGR